MSIEWLFAAVGIIVLAFIVWTLIFWFYAGPTRRSKEISKEALKEPPVRPPE